MREACLTLDISSAVLPADSKINVEPRPRSYNTSMIAVRQLVKDTGRNVDICRLTPSASIRDREIHTSLLTSLLIEPRRANLLSTQRVLVRVAACLYGIEDEVTDCYDVVGVCVEDAACAESWSEVCEVSSVDLFV